MSGFEIKYDSELQAFLDNNPDVSRVSLSPGGIEALRSNFQGSPIDQITTGRNLESKEIIVPGYQGHELAMTIIYPKGSKGPRPAIFHIHSGGMIAGDRLVGMGLVAKWAEELQLVATTIEYRLAPEYPDPYPVQDCYQALRYVMENAEELGIDSNKVILAGMSAGGGLAAGVHLLNRDQKGPQILGQLLMCPMLDEKNDSESSRQFVDIGLWDQGSNETGWNALLGDRRRTELVSIYASPSRNLDFEDYPATFLDVGSLEVFRSEVVDYARKIWLAGGSCELHVWPDAFHGFDLSCPEAEISKRAVAARTLWLQILLGH